MTIKWQVVKGLIFPICLSPKNPGHTLDFQTQGNYNVIIVKASIVKIGNSRGIRIPKPVFEQCGFKDEVDMEVHNQELVIRSTHKPRKGWAEAFQAMAKHDEDIILNRLTGTGATWGEDEWEWK